MVDEEEDLDKTVVIAPAASRPSIGIRYADMRLRASQVDPAAAYNSDEFDPQAYDLELPPTDRVRAPRVHQSGHETW